MSSNLDLLKLDNVDLLGHMLGSHPGSETHEGAKAVLQQRGLDAQAKTADELVKATKALGRDTKALVWATAVLVLVTGASLFWHH